MEATAANASWDAVNSGPDLPSVNRGSTSVTPASATTVVRAEPVPTGLKWASRCRRAPTARARPTMPLRQIITAANTVSRASVEVSDFSGPPLTISVTISATSMTVTATASTSEPNGSPTRWATTSAWCTAASTAAARVMPTTSTSTVGRSRPQAATSTTRAAGGASFVQSVTGPP